MRLKVNAVLLDLDGTLLDHEGASSAAFLAVCNRWVPNLAAEQHAAALSHWRALEATHMRAYLDGKLSFAEQRRQRVRGILETFGHDRIATNDAELDELFAAYLPAYQAAWRAFDDVPQAMSFFRKAPGGVAVFSNGDRAQQRAKLGALGLAPEPRLFVPADVGAPKPQPEAFLRACLAMGTDPARVLYIGDDLVTDAMAALKAGLMGCWLQRRAVPNSSVEGPTLHVQSLLDVSRYIEWATDPTGR